MKKFALIVAAAAITASAAFAAPAPVYSQNAVGFINIDAKAGEIYSLTFPFNDMASTNAGILFKDTQLAKDAPTGSYVYFWSGTSWSPYSKGRNGFTTSYELKPGECFFFQPAKDMTITMCGEVPDDATLACDITPAGNITAVGNPYPVPMVFKDSKLAMEASTGAYVYFWSGKSWSPYSKGRNGFTTTYEVAPGEGFFFQTTSKDSEAKAWTVEKPYVFP